MTMIRVVVTGSAREGRFPYRIETEGTRLANILVGISATPLLDACRKLAELGAADLNARIGLYSPEISDWRLRTTVGYGAKYTVEETASGPKFRPHRIEPEVLAKQANEALERSNHVEGIETAPQPENGVEATGAKPARSPEEPRPHHKRPTSQAGTGRAHAKPAKPETTPHKRKPTGSGGRRGRR